MGLLYYVKASDVDFKYCFLEVSRGEAELPFMEIKISDDKKLSFFIYAEHLEVSLTSEEWMEIYEKALLFYKKELDN